MAAPDDCDRVDSSINHLCKLIKVPSVLIVSNLPFVRLPGRIDHNAQQFALVQTLLHERDINPLIPNNQLLIDKSKYHSFISSFNLYLKLIFVQEYLKLIFVPEIEIL